MRQEIGASEEPDASAAPRLPEINPSSTGILFFSFAITLLAFKTGGRLDRYVAYAYLLLTVVMGLAPWTRIKEPLSNIWVSFVIRASVILAWPILFLTNWFGGLSSGLNHWEELSVFVIGFFWLWYLVMAFTVALARWAEYRRDWISTHIYWGVPTFFLVMMLVSWLGQHNFWSVLEMATFFVGSSSIAAGCRPPLPLPF